MKNLNDVPTVTPNTLKKKMRGAINPNLNHSDPPDKKVTDLRLANIIAFYPNENKCRIRMRNTNNLFTARLSNNIIGYGVNQSFIPPGKEYTCKITGYEAIKPYDVYTCLVLAIGGDYDNGGAVVIQFVAMNDTVFPVNNNPGSYIIKNNKSEIELKNDELLVNSPKILFNGSEMGKGEKGDPGPKGEKGDKGDKGDVGEPGYVSQDVINQIIATVESNIFERDHPVGSPYFTGSVSDNPNNKYPGSSWERLDSNTYIVAAGDGLNALQQVGSNNKSFSIDWLHNHLENPHSHENYNRTSNFSSTGNQYGGRMGTAGDNSGTITATAPTTATNQSAGTQQSNKTINVQPNSIALYIWIRTA